MLTCYCKKLHPDAVKPTKNYSKDAGWDLYTVEDVRLTTGSITYVKTGLAIKIPDGWFALIQDRSGRAKAGLKKNGGVMDAPYVGEWIILMTLLKSEPGSVHTSVDIPKGSKIAQFVLLPVPEAEMEWVDELPDTDRGSRGFGSSG
jgi:dUTP pyrophosphatase